MLEMRIAKIFYKRLMAQIKDVLEIEIHDCDICVGKGTGRYVKGIEEFSIASIKHQKLFGLRPITLTVQFLHIFRLRIVL